MLIAQRYECDGVMAGGNLDASARDTQTGRAVRLRAVSREARYVSPEAIFRFKKTAEALKGLEHPNLERVLDVGEDSGLVYVTTEEREGALLASKTKELPPPGQVVRWMLSAVKGLPLGARTAAAPSFRQRSASKISAVMMMLWALRFSTIQSSAASKLSLTILRWMSGWSGMRIGLLLTKTTGT